jgi:hypothetical protein
VPIAEVGRVIEQCLVVGAAVEIDSDHAVGMDAGGGGVDGELADRDVGAVDVPVADAEDLLRVRDDDEVDVLGPEVEGLERLADGVGMVDGEVDRA